MEAMSIHMTKIVKLVGVGVTIYRFNARKIIRQVIKFHNIYVWDAIGFES
jgi:hypothetical protein